MSMSEVQCPKCGQKSAALFPVTPSVVKKLEEQGLGSAWPAEMCDNCFKNYAGSVGKGSFLMAQEKVKEQHKMSLWKSRTSLIKRARELMMAKMYADAAVSYEKYIRVLEMVFSVNAGELTPEIFKERAQNTELTVLATVYWDLVRIYDTSDKFSERQVKATKQLAKFLKFTPILPDIVRKATTFQKSARKPEVIKQFLKSVSEARSSCFIATAAFRDPMAKEVCELRDFRDNTLMESELGVEFVFLYYRISPAVAQVIEVLAPLRWVVRTLLRIFLIALRRVQCLNRSDDQKLL